MDECVALAKDVAATVAERFALPVYLYEEASNNPPRKNLEDIRRGEFEGLAAKMGSRRVGAGLWSGAAARIGGRFRRSARACR